MSRIARIALGFVGLIEDWSRICRIDLGLVGLSPVLLAGLVEDCNFDGVSGSKDPPQEAFAALESVSKKRLHSHGSISLPYRPHRLYADRPMRSAKCPTRKHLRFYFFLSIFWFYCTFLFPMRFAKRPPCVLLSLFVSNALCEAPAP